MHNMYVHCLNTHFLNVACIPWDRQSRAARSSKVLEACLAILLTIVCVAAAKLEFIVCQLHLYEHVLCINTLVIYICSTPIERGIGRL